MSETTIHTLVDGSSSQWQLAGELRSFEAEKVSDAQQLVFDLVGQEGYKIISIPAGIRETLRDHIHTKIFEITRKKLSDIGTYHQQISEEEHLKIIDVLRETRFADFGEEARGWVRDISAQTGLTLEPIIKHLGHDHIQIRTVRPGLFDFNPPHKDAYLTFWHDVLNIWIPINYLGQQAIMPLCPGSHLWPEKDILRTNAKGATVGTYSYRVPAVVAYRHEPLQMTKPALKEEDCLVFTPHLVHGFGINPTQQTRFALEFRLEVIR